MRRCQWASVSLTSHSSLDVIFSDKRQLLVRYRRGNLHSKRRGAAQAAFNFKRTAEHLEIFLNDVEAKTEIDLLAAIGGDANLDKLPR